MHSEVRTALESLFEHRARSLPLDELADVYCRLIWCLADNGAEVVAMQRDWLRGNDIERVRVALEMDEVIPFKSKTEGTAVLQSIAERFEELRGICERRAREWSAESSQDA